jgi:hypothetical protein
MKFESIGNDEVVVSFDWNETKNDDMCRSFLRDEPITLKVDDTSVRGVVTGFDYSGGGAVKATMSVHCIEHGNGWPKLESAFSLSDAELKDDGSKGEVCVTPEMVAWTYNFSVADSEWQEYFYKFKQVMNYGPAPLKADWPFPTGKAPDPKPDPNAKPPVKGLLNVSDGRYLGLGFCDEPL